MPPDPHSIVSSPLQVAPIDLKNRTGSSIYFWETETNGGHIGGPPEEYNGVTETKIKTLTFSTES